MQNNATSSSTKSRITPVGYQAGDCGYCKAQDSSQRTPNSRASYYARSKSLSPAHYQELMDRGWRRSGSVLYLPDAARSCCPHYTIRLPSSHFKPSRDQRQMLNRWNRFVLGDKYVKAASIKYPKSKREKKQANECFNLSAVVHEGEIPNLKPGLEPEHLLEVTLEPDTFAEEKYKLFENYQSNVHHEGPTDMSRRGFQGFLCGSPVQRYTEPSGKKLGSFHQCYRLDGRLIAMSVIDLLPFAVSGVYFIYHHDFEKWSFGKLSALRETALALTAGYEHYYMGYYIHGCGKMRYKGDYKPQYVLDYDGFGWDLLDDCMRGLMDRRKYVSMSRERERDSSQSDAGQTKAVELNGRRGEDEVNATRDADEDPYTYGEVNYPVALEAANSDLSLLELGMPGVTPLSQLYSQVDLKSMKISLGGGGLYRMEDIVSWNHGSELERHSIKGIIAEYAACVGPRIVAEAVLDFSR